MAATVTRVPSKTSSSSKPDYKEYVNFLGNYRGGCNVKKDDRSCDSGVSSLRSYPLSGSASTASSTSSLNSDVPDCGGKPVKTNGNGCTQRSEIYIELSEPDLPPCSPPCYASVHPKKSSGSVSEVSKIFEKVARNGTRRSAGIQRNNSRIEDRINIFENNDQKNGKVKARSLSSSRLPPPPQITLPTTQTPLETPLFAANEQPRKNSEGAIPRLSDSAKPKIMDKPSSPPPLPPPMAFATAAPTVTAPPPPPLPNFAAATVPVQKFAAKKPPTHPASSAANGPRPTNGFNASSAANPGSVVSSNGQIDKNDPMVRKLVYGTLRGMYGAYHEKANSMVATMPRNMVRKDNNIQNIIETIAFNGGLDKLNGRVNPKGEQE